MPNQLAKTYVYYSHTYLRDSKLTFNYKTITLLSLLSNKILQQKAF